MNSTTPQLAPPGAGLPGPELWIARILFSVRRRTSSREAIHAIFENERRAIARLVASCDGSAASRRVLIKRLPGLEDSSRHWSVWMTLDHLRIVNHEFAQVIRLLAQGRAPSVVASTAAVKPSAEASAAVVIEYEASCDALQAVVREVPDLKTTVQYAHPWFGPLDAAGWHALSATHMGIHRRQIEKILAGAAQSSTQGC